MDGPRDYHTKWSKSERERQIPYDITYMWNLKYDTNEIMYKTETEKKIQELWTTTKYVIYVYLKHQKKTGRIEKLSEIGRAHV